MKNKTNKQIQGDDNEKIIIEYLDMLIDKARRKRYPTAEELIEELQNG